MSSTLFRRNALAITLITTAFAAPAVADRGPDAATDRVATADAQSRTGVALPLVAVRSATTDVALVEADRQRVAAKIAACLANAATSGGDASRAFRVEVAITSYDKGNTYVRSMVSGVAAVHADLAVNLVSRVDGRVARQIKLSQEFEPTVVSSSNSRIEDIEDALAVAVAEAVRGAEMAIRPADRGPG